MASLLAAVTNITLFVKRFPGVEDMALIVPGLEKPPLGAGGLGSGAGGEGSGGGLGGVEAGCSGIEVTARLEDLESESGTHNPTIIL